MQPFTVFIRHNTLGSQDNTVLSAVFISQLLKNTPNLLFRKFLRRLFSPACEHLIGVVMALMTMMMVIVSLAAAVIMMIMVVMVLFVMAVPAIVEVFFMVMAFMAVVMFMIMLVVVAVLAFMVMVTTFRADLRLAKKVFSEIILSFHNFKNLRPGDILPWGCDNRGAVIERADQLNSFLQFVFLHILSTA